MKSFEAITTARSTLRPRRHWGWIASILMLACSADADVSTSESGSLSDSVTEDTTSPQDTEDCTADSADCTCILEPQVPEDACWHGHGGRFSDGACSSSSQCCDGDWEDLESCGECVCTQSTGTEGCVPEEEGELVCFPRFVANIEALSETLQSQMSGVSYHEGCPVGLDEIRLLQMSHWGFDGEIHQGQLVVASDVSELIRDAFAHAYNWRFAIETMKPVSEFGGSDDASMAANNTSAFNCRAVTSGSSWSQHSYGNAIDINPVQNPYVSGSLVLPPAGKPYVERDPTISGLIFEPGPVTGPFLRRGWGWGGQWNSLKDYQHFSETGQ